MSLKNWGCKIKAQKADVLKCLHQLAASMNGTLEACDQSTQTDQDNVCLLIASDQEDQDSTVIGWYEAGMVPEIVIYLSKELGTSVVSVDQQENIGYQHFSELNAGTLTRMYTGCDAEDPAHRDFVNTPDDYLIDIAKRKESKGFLSRVKEDPSQFAFDLLVAEHNMQTFPQEELFESPPDLECYQILVKGLGQRFLGSFESAENQVGRYWSDLV